MLELLGMAVAGFLAGYLVTRRKQRALPKATGLLVPPTLPPEEYQKDRTFYIDMYKTSMQQYDKLVPWVAGGGLVVSVPLLREINSIGGSRVALAVGWLALLLAVACSVTGHYMSTRIYSSERAALDTVNRSDATE
jgi:hypothetical protein